VTISLAFHAALFIAFMLASKREARQGNQSPVIIDTWIASVTEEVSVNLFDPQPVSARPDKPVERSQLVSGPPSSPQPPDHRPPILQTTRATAAGATVPASALGEPTGISDRASGENESGVGRPAFDSSFFQLPPGTGSVIYVLDRSASMGLHGRLNAAKQELLTSLKQLPANTRFQIIFYNRAAEPLRIGGRTELALASAANKKEVEKAIEMVRAEGSTYHQQALERALAYHADVVFFLTDADDLRPEEVRAIALRNQGRSIINTIELATRQSDASDYALQILAGQNRGVHRHIVVASGW
jgi:hypothetical protein